MTRPVPAGFSAAARYDQALAKRRRRHRRPDLAQPLPTREWPAEHVALLERYAVWLFETGVARNCILQLYIPSAGHLLGLAAGPCSRLDPARDGARVVAFLAASGYSAGWQRMWHNALRLVGRFLAAERGQVQPNLPPLPDLTRYQRGLPAWLVQALCQMQTVRQAHWRPERRAQTAQRFWSVHTCLWRWLLAHYPVQQAADVQRAQLYAYIDARLAAGRAVTTINMELHSFQATLRFLQQQDMPVPLAVLRLRGLRQADALPRFLTAEQVARLQTALAEQVQTAPTAVQQRDARLDRAAFYLFWHGGLRVGEVEALQLADLDLAQQRLVVRRGKGIQDRSVYLTAAAVTALEDYLALRGPANSDHVFIYRFKPLCKDLLRDRLHAAGRRVGVHVTPHQLRHTFATQLLNAGCQVMSIQQLLGHRRLNSTLVYARLHDRTVAEDYFRAMERIER